MKEAAKLLCEHLQMIPQKDIQQDCLEFCDNVVQAYLQEYPESEIAGIFMGDLITTYTCANCSHFTATVTKETAIQMKIIIASSRMFPLKVFYGMPFQDQVTTRKGSAQSVIMVIL